MKLHTLGTGGPRPDPERNASSYVLEVSGRKFMFDVGRGAIGAIAKQKLAFAEIGPLFVTHHHVDHIGEIADYLIASWLAGRRSPLRVYGPPGTRSILDTYFERIYDKDIAFRTEGETTFGPFIGADVVEVRNGLVHEADGIRVHCAEIEHGHGLAFGPIFRARWICLAYRVESEGRAFSFSGDAVMCDPLIAIAKGVDLHLQCCYMAASDLDTAHFKGVAKYTLACSDTAGKIAARAGAKRLVLTHFRYMTPDKLVEIERDVRADFTGPVDLARDGATFEF
jgi:ribonuclease Z